jgi:RNA polymerase sigma-70 factor (ECF subfamily)
VRLFFVGEVLLLKPNPNIVNYISDEQIMNKVKAGQVALVSELFERYNKQVYRYFLHLSANDADSQDLTQNVFLRLLQYSGTYQEGKSFKNWLFRMSRNLYYTHYRQLRQEPEPLTVQNTSAAVAAEPTDRYENLHRCLHLLSDEYRELVVLSKIQGWKYKEIASLYGVTEAAIKNRIYRALNQLRMHYFEIEKN